MCRQSDWLTSPYLPEKDMIVLMGTGWTGSPSVAIRVKPWPSMVNWAGQTEAKELITRNRYLRPGVTVKISRGVLVMKPVLGSRNCPFPLISNDSGSWPVLTAKRPGYRSAASSWSQSLINMMCVVKSKSYRWLLGSLDGGWRTITLP